MASMQLRWSRQEKRKLVNLLTVYPLDAYKNLAKKLGTKSAEQVEEYIAKLTASVQRKSARMIQRPPLETWQDVARKLVENESFDCATQLSKVMSMVSNFEKFPTATISGHPQPDYKSIYRYLSHSLQHDRHEDLEKLGHLESAIVLELLHGLMEVLSSCDMSVQRNVIRWKYLLMCQRNAYGGQNIQCMRMASENEFTDFIEQELQQMRDRYKPRVEPGIKLATTFGVKVADDAVVVGSTYVSSDKTLRSEPEETYTVSENVKRRLKKTIQNGTECVEQSGNTGEKEKTAERQEQSGNTGEKEKTAERQVQEDAGEAASTLLGRPKKNMAPKEKPPTIVNAKSLVTSYQKPDFDIANLRTVNRPAWQHKRGVKGKYDQPEKKVTEIVMVMPPKDVKIIKSTPRSKKMITLRDDGKYMSLNKDKAKTGNGSDTETICRVEHADRVKPVESSSGLGKTSESYRRELDKERNIHVEKCKRKYACLMNKPEKETQWKKPKLYSLNPFCLPVSLLDLNTQAEVDKED